MKITDESLIALGTQVDYLRKTLRETLAEAETAVDAIPDETLEELRRAFTRLTESGIDLYRARHFFRLSPEQLGDHREAQEKQMEAISRAGGGIDLPRFSRER